MDCEVDVSPEEILKTFIAEWALPNDGSVGLGEDESVRRGSQE